MLHSEEYSVKRILLVNPNTNTATTAMMARRLRSALAGQSVEVASVTAARGPSMITDGEALSAAAAHVVDAVVAELEGRDQSQFPDAVVVAAFGDPGVPELRELPELAGITVTGIGEAAVREAGADGRPFAIATTTGELADSIASLVDRVGMASSYKELELTETEPLVLATSREASHRELAAAVKRSLAKGAERVIIGGGPLSDVASDLYERYPGAIVEPVAAAARHITGYQPNVD